MDPKFDNKFSTLSSCVFYSAATFAIMPQLSYMKNGELVSKNHSPSMKPIKLKPTVKKVQTLDPLKFNSDGEVKRIVNIKNSDKIQTGKK